MLTAALVMILFSPFFICISHSCTGRNNESCSNLLSQQQLILIIHIQELLRLKLTTKTNVNHSCMVEWSILFFVIISESVR